MLQRRSVSEGSARSRLRRLAEGLDTMLGDFVGSASIGPYVAPEDEQPRPDIDCPSCGRPISQHLTDRSPAIGRLYCPPALAQGPDRAELPG